MRADMIVRAGGTSAGYLIAPVRGAWYAFRADGTKIITAHDEESIQAAIAVDRRQRDRRIPLQVPAAA
jgi:hypothetical protein